MSPEGTAGLQTSDRGSDTRPRLLGRLASFATEPANRADSPAIGASNTQRASPLDISHLVLAESGPNHPVRPRCQGGNLLREFDARFLLSHDSNGSVDNIVNSIWALF